MRKYSNLSHTVKSFSPVFTKPLYDTFKSVTESFVRKDRHYQADIAAFTGKTLRQVQYFFSTAKWSFEKLNEFRLRFLRNKPDFRDRRSDYAVLDGSTIKKDRSSSFKDNSFGELMSQVYSNRDKAVVNGMKIFGASVLTKGGVKYILDFVLYFKAKWLSEFDAWKAFASMIAMKTGAFVFLIDSGFRNKHFISHIYHTLKRHFLIRLLPSQYLLVPEEQKKKGMRAGEKRRGRKELFPNHKRKKISSLLKERESISVQNGKMWVIHNAIVNAWKDTFDESVTVVVYWRNGFKDPVVVAYSGEVKEGDNEDAFRIMEMYFDRWSIEQLFKEVKTWFSFEKFKVTSLEGIQKFLHMIVFVHSLISVLWNDIKKQTHIRETVDLVLRKIRNITECTVISLKLFFEVLSDISVSGICLKRQKWLSKEKKKVLLCYFL